MTSRPERAPDGTGPAGRRLWRAITDEYELEQHERALLVEAVRTLDALDALEQTVRDEGVLHDTPQGTRAHPGLVEARQQRLVLAKLLSALRLPAGEEQPGADRRPQRRPARGGYPIRSVS